MDDMVLERESGCLDCERERESGCLDCDRAELAQGVKHAQESRLGRKLEKYKSQMFENAKTK